MAPAEPPVERSRRGAILAIAVVALLVVAGVVVFAATALAGYPEKYLLDEDEQPDGMRIARLSQDERDELGVTENPGRIDREKLRSDYETQSGVEPEDGYALVLADGSGARIAVLAFQYANEEDAQAGAREARAVCSFAGGAVLRDGDVVVLVVRVGGSSSNAVSEVAAALRDKEPDLARVCGP